MLWMWNGLNMSDRKNEKLAALFRANRLSHAYMITGPGRESFAEEMAVALADICERNNMSMEQFQEHYDQDMHNAIKNSVLTGKVMEWLRNNAEVTVVEK